MVYDLRALRAKLDRGEWLRPGEAGALIGVSRGTVHNMLKDGRLTPHTAGGRKLRVVSPIEIRAILAADEVAARKVDRAGHGTSPETGNGVPPSVANGAPVDPPSAGQ